MPKQDPKSGKMGRSSKTARVLNLLTAPESIEPHAKPDEPQAAGGAKLSDDRSAQDKIRNALEDSLEMELSAAMSTPAHPKRSRTSMSSILRKSTQTLEQKLLQENDDAGAEEPSAPGDWP